MLEALGFASRAALIDAVIPAAIRRTRAAAARRCRDESEAEALAALREHRARKNQVFRSFIGQGYYGTHTPPVILRNVLENPGVVHGLHAVPARDLARAGSRRCSTSRRW